MKTPTICVVFLKNYPSAPLWIHDKATNKRLGPVTKVKKYPDGVILGRGEIPGEHKGDIITRDHYGRLIGR